MLNIIKKKKPDFIIIHLLTALPLILLILGRYNTKFILRISGYPKINFIRYLFWKVASKKIYRITCPTKETYNLILKKNIIDNTNLKLLIAGNGERKNELLKLINKLDLQNKVFLIGHTKNIFKYMSKCNCFILASLWEDPGFVLLEAAACRAVVISSNCKSGPIEIIKNKTTGYSFKSNDSNDFINKYNNYLNEDNKNLKKIKLIYINKPWRFNGLKFLKKYFIY